MRTPLQVVLLRDALDRGTDVYADTLRLTFEGSAGTAESPSAYLDDAVDLGIRVLEPVQKVTDEEIERLLDGAEHTIVVVIGEPLNQGASLLIERLDSNKVVRVAAPLPPSQGEIQGEKAFDGVERAFAPTVTALRTMQRARRVLAQDTDGDDQGGDSLALFISHAKIDGVAMAKSLIAILRQLREVEGEETLEFEYFYDDEHLKPGMVWREILDAKAKQSVLIVLRTEGYESRYWCRREYLSAERNGMPIIVVDLRKAQYHGCALLPFDLVPAVRVHDGNIIRVVLHAMAAHLRVLRVRSQAPAGIRVLPHRPSVYSLDGARQAASRKVAYPGPRLPDAYRLAVQPILAKGKPQMELMTFDDLEDQ